MDGAYTLSDRVAADSVIRWWRDAGVDTLIEEDAQDWLARRNPSPGGETVVDQIETGKGAIGPSSAPPKRPSAPNLGPDGERVALPRSLPALLSWMGDSAEVPEARWGRTRILPAGNLQSDLMIL